MWLRIWRADRVYSNGCRQLVVVPNDKPSLPLQRQRGSKALWSALQNRVSTPSPTRSAQPPGAAASHAGETLMNVEDGFLRAIIDHPYDDTPRLVYADWLEEQGDLRNEFLRLQHELARLPVNDSRYAELAVREQVLLTLEPF